jgi:hypothetical protein
MSTLRQDDALEDGKYCGTQPRRRHSASAARLDPFHRSSRRARSPSPAAAHSVSAAGLRAMLETCGSAGKRGVPSR